MTDGLIGALGSIGTSLINNYMEDKRAAVQRDWNEQMMDKQNAWSLEMWNKTNEYNSPEEQLKRLTDAGLNPLYYGLDGSSAGGLQSAQPLGYERGSTSGIANPVAAYYDAILKNAQIDNINSNTAKQNEETVTEVERRLNLKKDREEADARIDKYKSERDLNEAQKDKLDKFAEYADGYYQSMIDINSSTSKLNDSKRQEIDKLLPGKETLQKMSIKDYVQKWKVWSSQIDHMFAQDKVLGKEAKYYLLSLLTNGLYGTGISTNNALIMSFMADDPDLTQADVDMIKEALGMEDETKNKGKKNRDFLEIGDMTDPQGNFFGSTF